MRARAADHRLDESIQVAREDSYKELNVGGTSALGGLPAIPETVALIGSLPRI